MQKAKKREHNNTGQRRKRADAGGRKLPQWVTPRAQGPFMGRRLLVSAHTPSVARRDAARTVSNPMLPTLQLLQQPKVPGH